MVNDSLCQCVLLWYYWTNRPGFGAYHGSGNFRDQFSRPSRSADELPARKALTSENGMSETKSRQATHTIRNADILIVGGGVSGALLAA